MAHPLPNLRYEKKFVADGFTVAEVLATIQRHPAAFREAYPPRIVNNVYFDSPTRRDYLDHVHGTANRSKTRVRWYGPQFEVADRPVLERKLKRGTVSGKESYALPEFSVGGGGFRAAAVAAFDQDAVPPMLRACLHPLEPALFNRYHRRYFICRSQKFRLTVDSGLQFASVQTNRKSWLDSNPAVATVVIELKFGPEVAEDAEVITNALPYRLCRFSKYVAGIERL